MKFHLQVEKGPGRFEDKIGSRSLREERVTHG